MTVPSVSSGHTTSRLNTQPKGETAKSTTASFDYAIGQSIPVRKGKNNPKDFCTAAPDTLG